MRSPRIKKLRALAGDKRLIPGIYNYCDRWCERCPLTERCMNFAMQQSEDSGDPAERDLDNDKFWKKLSGIFADTLELIRETAKERGIDLDAPDAAAEAAERTEERAARRFASENKPLTKAAMAYLKAAGAWMKKAGPLFKDKGVELATQARLSVGEPESEAARLKEFVDVIHWYQHFIYVKLSRAIDSAAREALETDEEMKQFPKDSEGTAKIALIAIDRSIGACAGLREMLGAGGDSILDLLAMLARIRRDTETLFPNARSFVRPGFDEPKKPRRKTKG